MPEKINSGGEGEERFVLNTEILKDPEKLRRYNEIVTKVGGHTQALHDLVDELNREYHERDTRG